MDSRKGFMVCQTDIEHVMCDVSEGPFVDFRYNIVYCMKGLFQIDSYFHPCFTVSHENFFVCDLVKTLRDLPFEN